MIAKLRGKVDTIGDDFALLTLTASAIWFLLRPKAWAS